MPDQSGSRIPACLGVAPVEQRDVADSLHDFGRGAAGEFRQNFVALVAVADPGPHLDEFVIVQRAVSSATRFGLRPAWPTSTIGIAVVAEPAEVLALCGSVRGMGDRSGL